MWTHFNEKAVTLQVFENDHLTQKDLSLYPYKAKKKKKKKGTIL